MTQEVTLNMAPASGILNDTRGDSQVIFTGGIAIDRTQYGVEGERWSKLKEGITAVDKMVNIEVSILGKQLNQRNLSGWVRNPERPPGKLYKAVKDNGVEEAMKVFNELKADPESRLNANALRIAGFVLLKEGRTEDALKVLKANMEAFPEEGDATDSYAEALATTGDYKSAIKFYKVALEKDPNNENAREVLRYLE